MTAQLVRLHGGDELENGQPVYTVRFSCSDNLDPSPHVTSAMINGVAVANGQTVNLRIFKTASVQTKNGVLTITGPAISLVVTCMDANGNVGTATVSVAANGTTNDGKNP